MTVVDASRKEMLQRRGSREYRTGRVSVEREREKEGGKREGEKRKKERKEERKEETDKEKETITRYNDGRTKTAREVRAQGKTDRNETKPETEKKATRWR